MNQEQRIVYTLGILLQAKIELEAMIAENQQRAFSGEAPAYNGSSFTDLIDRYGVNHNGIIMNLIGH